MTMLLTLLLSFLVIVLVIIAMSIGIMAGRQPIKGSCGGLNSGGCELCRGSCRSDREPQSEDRQQTLSRIAGE